MVKRIKPVSRIDRIEAEVKRIIGEVFSQRVEVFGLEEAWYPCIDICESINEYRVDVELPGISQKDISIILHSNRIEIKGTKKENLPPSGVRYVRLEREYGSFSRVIALPGPVLPEKARATLENGVLTVRMEKLRKGKEKEVKLKIQKSTDYQGGSNG
ncbi:MAG: Hsp20/alpha crystallin family protein [Candidatus Aminicenantales bacterium]